VLIWHHAAAGGVGGPLHPTWEITPQEWRAATKALEAISIAEVDELIRRTILVRKRFTGLCEAEDYRAAAAPLERSDPLAARKPAAKAEGAESRRPHKNYGRRKPRLQLISPVLRALLTCRSKVRN
jgi:hypothetical protein